MNHKPDLAGVLLLCLLTLIACQPSPAATPVLPTATPTPGLLRVDFPNAPATLCREAAQLRLRPQLTGLRPAAPLTWVITGTPSPLSGEWDTASETLYVAFPAGRSLAPGEYTLTLYRDSASVGQHTFTIVDVPPEIASLTLALTPDGPSLTTVNAGTHLFYLRYTYTGACTGTPLWVAAYLDTEPLCRGNFTIEQERGAETFACYREDATPFEVGDYRALVTLMGDITQGVAFQVREPPPPPPSPLHCEAPFVAAGLTPEGESFRPGDRFEWYTQSLYVGQTCEGLQPGALWEAAWYRQGVQVRAASGAWDGGVHGLVWDSFTGETFLRSGVYTVTLRIADQPPAVLDFRIIAYATPTPAP